MYQYEKGEKYRDRYLGIVFTGECQGCGYKKSFRPFTYTRNKKWVISNLWICDEVSNEHKKCILEFFEQPKKVKIDLSKFDLFICSNCYNLESKYYYEIYLDDIELIPTHYCKQCNNELKRAKSNLVDHSWEAYKDLKLNCPSCKNRKLVLEKGVLELEFD